MKDVISLMSQIPALNQLQKFTTITKHMLIKPSYWAQVLETREKYWSWQAATD